MIDSLEIAPQEGQATRPAERESVGERPPWLLLIHQIPPKPDYFRVKVRRRLRRLGALALKNSVYVLPNGDEALEDFQWLQQEIAAEGADAAVCEASFVAGMSNEELAARFHQPAESGAGPDDTGPPDRVAPGRTWVTRQNVFVDRMGSAWLIRRFIDPRARFKFVAGRGYPPAPSELRFDMFDGEYTHQGDRCTFETLLARFRLRDRGLAAIAEIVHDLDCKDEKFGRRETPGVGAMLRAITLAEPDDQERLVRAAVLFDDLHRHFATARH